MQAVLAARIDQLPLPSKRLLQVAAVIGKDVPLPLLQAVGGLPEEVLDQQFAQLQAREFLYELFVESTPAYTFTHALSQEVAYGSLLQERRRALHARIVEAIERLYPDRIAEQVERLAHQALQGEVWDKAVTYCRQAGVKAVARSAYREVLASFEQAVVALQHLPQSSSTCAQAIDLRFDLRRSLLPLGERGRILDYLREAETLAEALGDRCRLGQVAARMTEYFTAMGDHDRAIASGQQTLALAAELGDFALQVMANQRLGRAYLMLGDYRQATDILKRNVASLEGELRWERFGQLSPPRCYPVAGRSAVWQSVGSSPRGSPTEKQGSGLPRRSISHTASATSVRASACCISRRGNSTRPSWCSNVPSCAARPRTPRICIVLTPRFWGIRML